MHELSLVMNIIDIAAMELDKAKGTEVESIELEIGSLSTVERESFDFAWRQAVPETCLSDASCQIITVTAMGKCSTCGKTFPVKQLYDACPQCGGFDVEITSGRELRVKSMIIS